MCRFGKRGERWRVQLQPGLRVGHVYRGRVRAVDGRLRDLPDVQFGDVRRVCARPVREHYRGFYFGVRDGVQQSHHVRRFRPLRRLHYERAVQRRERVHDGYMRIRFVPAFRYFM